MGCGFCKNYDFQYFMSGVPKDCRSGSERIPKLIPFEEFDKATRLPNLLVELRQVGYVEISGKNHYAVHDRLGMFLKNEWRCELKTHVSIPVCDVRYELPKDLIILSINHPDRDHQENNMGRLVLQLVAFMSNELGWTLSLCNTAGASPCREAQIKFKAPNPLNLVAPHMLVELRSPNVGFGGGAGDGFIEMNCSHPGNKQTQEAVVSLGTWVRQHWGVKKYDWKGCPETCDMKVQTSALQIRGLQGENNIGMRTVQLADFMTSALGWTMLTCDLGGHIKREQQMVFRCDVIKSKEQTTSTMLLVELRQLGYVEVSGQDSLGVYSILDAFFKKHWECSEYDWKGERPFCNMKYVCPAMDPSRTSLGDMGMQLIDFMQGHGWSFFILNGGEISTDGDLGVRDSRFHGRPCQELQLKFLSPYSQQEVLPVLLVQLIADVYHPGHIMISGKDVEGVYDKLDSFITGILESLEIEPMYCARQYSCPAFFLSAGNFAGSNLDYITMRFVDFLEDHVGGWELVACSSHHPSNTQMEQMLAFRYAGASRKAIQHGEMQTAMTIGGPVEDIVFPRTWKMINPLEPAVGPVHITGRATLEEQKLLQAMLDDTFKAVQTRDREGDLPTRLVLVEAVVSEHVELYRRYSVARDAVPGDYRIHDSWRPITRRCELAGRSDLSQEKNEAYVMHGTQPSSALSILQSGFSLDLAGESTGLMFGKGIYCAERCSKADEYASPDHAHPGIFAMIICRAAVGRCLEVTEAGDFTEKLTSGYCETVLGDNETARGTYREFVIGSAERLYPEYAVMYTRQYDVGPRIPVPLPTPERESPKSEDVHSQTAEAFDVWH